MGKEKYWRLRSPRVPRWFQRNLEEEFRNEVKVRKGPCVHITRNVNRFDIASSRGVSRSAYPDMNASPKDNYDGLSITTESSKNKRSVDQFTRKGRGMPGRTEDSQRGHVELPDP